MWDWLSSWWPSGASAPSDPGVFAEAAAPATQAAAAPWSFTDVAKAIWEPVRSGISTLGGVAKEILPAAQLGAGVMGAVTSARAAGEMGEQAKIARRGQELQTQMARETAGAAAPLTQFGARELGRAEAGQLPPAIEQQIELWVQGSKQKAHDYLARAGQGESSTLEAWDAWIEQQAIAMRAQALQEQERIGISSLGAGAGALGGAGAQAGAVTAGAEGQMQGLEQLIAQANAQLAQLAGSAQ